VPLSAQVGGEWTAEPIIQGSSSGSGFGEAVAFLGDLNGDDVAEFAVGSPDEAHGGLQTVGGLRIFDGATRVLLREHFGQNLADRLGTQIVKLDDVDGDGVDDYAASQLGYDSSHIDIGAVHAWSGADGSLLWTSEGFQPTANWGERIASIVDVDNDGVRDLLVTSPNFTPRGAFAKFTGAVSLVSGATGAHLDVRRGKTMFSHLGRGIASVGDINGDGVEDFGMSRHGPSAVAPGYLDLISGADLSPLGTLQGEVDAEFDRTSFATSFCSLGDLDGDGADELAVSSPYADLPGLLDCGKVQVFRGRSLELLWEVHGETTFTKLGTHLRSGHDVDGDGLNDLLVTTFGPGPVGTLRVMSGSDGRKIARFNGDNALVYFGKSVDWGADLDGDGCIETIVGVPGIKLSGGNSGEVGIFSWSPLYAVSTTRASSSAGGQVDAELRFPASEAGNDYAILISAAGPGASPLRGGVEVPLLRDRLFDFSLQGILPFQFIDGNGQLDSAGRANAQFTWSPGQFAGDSGTTYWSCALTYDASGARMSSAALPLLITP